MINTYWHSLALICLKFPSVAQVKTVCRLFVLYFKSSIILLWHLKKNQNNSQTTMEKRDGLEITYNHY